MCPAPLSWPRPSEWPHHSHAFTEPFQKHLCLILGVETEVQGSHGLAHGPTAGHDQAGALPEPSTVYPRTISKLPASPSDCMTVNHFKDLAFPRGAGKCQAGVQSV